MTGAILPLLASGGRNTVAINAGGSTSGTYFANRNGSIFRSDGNSGISTSAVFNESTHQLSARIGDTFYFIGEDGNIYKTTDKFKTRTLITATFDSHNYSRNYALGINHNIVYDGSALVLVFSPNNGSNIYPASELFKSTDSGVTWTWQQTIASSASSGYAYDMLVGATYYVIPWKTSGGAGYKYVTKASLGTGTSVTTTTLGKEWGGVYNGSKHYILSSIDADFLTEITEATWGDGTKRIVSASIKLKGITYNPTLGKMIVCSAATSGSSGQLRIFYSPDGTTWTEAATVPTLSKNFTHIRWANSASTTLMYWSDDTTQGVIYSQDGITWQNSTLADTFATNPQALIDIT